MNPAPTRIPARPTSYNGIRMRSRLEAGYAQWLDRVGFKWAYEPECFATEDGQYLPDFLIYDVPVLGAGYFFSTDLYVEVKPDGWSDWESAVRNAGVLRGATVGTTRELAGIVLAVARPGPDRSRMVGILHDGAIGLQWLDPVSARHSDQPQDVPMLGFPLPGSNCPWPADYWKPTAPRHAETGRPA